MRRTTSFGPSSNKNSNESLEIAYWRTTLRNVAAISTIMSCLVRLLNDAATLNVGEGESSQAIIISSSVHKSLDQQDASDQFSKNITYDHEFYQQAKPTPSGWWPDESWIHDCVSKERDLKPFNNLADWDVSRS